MKFWAWGAMAVAIGTIGSTLAACGSSSSSGGGGAGGAAMSSSSSSSSTSSSSGMVKGSECKAQGTMCAQCCQKDFMAENNVLFSEVFMLCACNTPDGGMPPICNMACSGPNDVCTGGAASQGCADCINNMVIKPPDGGATNPCFVKAYMDCQNNPTCSPLINCVNTSCM